MNFVNASKYELIVAMSLKWACRGFMSDLRDPYCLGFLLTVCQVFVMYELQIKRNNQTPNSTFKKQTFGSVIQR
jgi:hypothetical protein